MRFVLVVKLLLICTLFFSVIGCKGYVHSRSANESHERNQQRAAELNRKAADLMFDDPIAAERILQEALRADLYHCPSHNNLGVLLFKRGELYQAAEEFDWAR